ncbi:hypothetical protein ABW21_db0201315 [Orbilia brochopaga]|nr:hypothetical protein ABW21_db0201315 [Drechslerella brochopaga]
MAGNLLWDMLDKGPNPPVGWQKYLKAPKVAEAPEPYIEVPRIIFEQYDEYPGLRIPYVQLQFDAQGNYHAAESSRLYQNMAGQVCLAARAIEIAPSYGQEIANPTIHASFTGEIGAVAGSQSYPCATKPAPVFPAHLPGPTSNERVAERLNLEASKDFVSLDNSTLKPGCKNLYVPIKNFNDRGAFYNAFNVKTGEPPECLKRHAMGLSRATALQQAEISTPLWKAAAASGNKRKKTTQSGSPKREKRPKVEHLVEPRVANLTEAPSIKDAGTGKKQRAQGKVSPESSQKIKRAVNTWIAYRTYFQSTYKAEHHQSQVSGRIKSFYDTLPDSEKAKWALVAKEYTQRRDAFPGATSAWLTAMNFVERGPETGSGSELEADSELELESDSELEPGSEQASESESESELGLRLVSESGFIDTNPEYKQEVFVNSTLEPTDGFSDRSPPSPDDSLDNSLVSSADVSFASSNTSISSTASTSTYDWHEVFKWKQD